MADLSTTSRRHQRVLQAIRAIQQGQMVILVDDEDRENEGDLCMAADKITPEAVNFMARYGRGLICLTLTPQKVDRLQLPLMRSNMNLAEDGGAPTRRTAFTVSIEAKQGVSTGISAHDRAHTIRTAVAKDARASDLVSPGHVFPLRACPGGVLQRTGHTEGSVDLAQLAGLEPAGVICEIMNDDGTMARMPDLRKFAEAHGLMLLTIAELVDYRMQTERLVSLVSVHENIQLRPKGLTWKLHCFQTFSPPPHTEIPTCLWPTHRQSQQVIGLTLGTISDEPCFVRVHTASVVRDVLHLGPHKDVLAQSIQVIESAKKGVLLMFPGSMQPYDELVGLTKQKKPGAPVAEATQGKDPRAELREYGLGAQVLRQLGASRLRILTNNPRKIIGLDGYGLEVVEQISPYALSEAMR